MIRSARFKNFKGLQDYTIHLKDINVLVGPNNAGKSTVLDGFRALAGAIKFAKGRIPDAVIGANKKILHGYYIPESMIPVSLANIHTDYEDIDTEIEFNLSNGNKLNLIFKIDRKCVLALNDKTSITRTTINFKNNYPISLSNIPTLGPFEEEENLLSDDYFDRWSDTRRSHRMFRNIWYRSADFIKFKQMVESTWPGMSILKPELVDYETRQILMFCKEGRFDREIYWAGYGFQIWLQLLTHLIKAESATTIIIDEPDIYLHPDLQRQLFCLLKGMDKQILLATHSVEIINEAEHDEVVYVDKKRKFAKRISDIEGLQEAIYSIGSSQNIHLARLSKGRKVLFFEGQDFKIIKRFASRLGLSGLASDVNITIISIGGFTQWRKIEDASWTFSKILETEIKLAALFDRDYRCDDEIEEFQNNLLKITSSCFILRRKELENYLLNIDAIVKSIHERLRDKSVDISSKVLSLYVETSLNAITDELKPNVLGQLSAHRVRYFDGKTKKDPSTIVSECIKLLEAEWTSLENRLSIVPGKQLLTLFNQKLQIDHKINITPALIIKHINIQQIPDDLVNIIRELDHFASE